MFQSFVFCFIKCLAVHYYLRFDRLDEPLSGTSNLSFLPFLYICVIIYKTIIFDLIYDVSWEKNLLGLMIFLQLYQILVH